MKPIDLIYEVVKRLETKVDTIQSTADKNSVVLEDHQRRSIANEKRLEILEKQSIKINWKTLSILCGIIASTCTIAFTIMKIIKL